MGGRVGGRVGGRRSEPKGSGVRGRLGCRPALPPTRAASFQNTSWRSTPFPSPAGFQKLRQLVLAPSWVQTLSEGGTRASKNSGLRFLEGQAHTGRQMLGVPARPQEVWPLPGVGEARAEGHRAERGRSAGAGAPTAPGTPGSAVPGPPLPRAPVLTHMSSGSPRWRPVGPRSQEGDQ